MIHLFVNALAASAGGGLTYVRNIVPHLSARQDVSTTLLVCKELRQELSPRNNIEFIDQPIRTGTLRRFLFEQRSLANLVRSSKATVLLSAGNFALRNSPVPQILLSRNALYTCPDFYLDLRKRREYRLWLDAQVKARLAKRSIEIAEVTVAPSRAFAEELRQWTGKDVAAIHHGFDSEAFRAHATALSPAVREKVESTRRGLRLLFRQPLQLLSEFRNADSRHGASRAQTRGRPVEAHVDVRTPFRSESRILSSRDGSPTCRRTRPANKYRPIGISSLLRDASRVSCLRHLCDPRLLRVVRSSAG